ncbi:MAG: single-stranded DNA-binding protein [Bacilli bacterium]|nr:single-stranded DNA-binding protein [Bacilli bacterium]
MNKVVLVGRITKDPELKYTTNNIPVAQFTIAVNRTYQSKSGERQADFINCVVWRQQAENFAKFMRKGSLIGVDGQIQTRNYDDANGVRRFVTEVICDAIHFLEPKSAVRGDSFGDYEMNQYESSRQTQKAPEQKNPFEDMTTDFDISNDDLPF